MKQNHQSSTCIRQISESLSVRHIPASKGIVDKVFYSLTNFIQQKGYYEFVYLNDILPGDARRRYLYMNTLENTGLSYPVMILTHSSGNNLGNSHFIWRVLDTDTVEQCFQKSLIVIDKVKLGIPQYYTRAM